MPSTRGGDACPPGRRWQRLLHPCCQAAVLPRWATIINTGPGTASGCSISPLTALPASFLYQTTNPATNKLTGTANTPVDIVEGAAQSFVLAFTPTDVIAPTEVQLNFGCTNSSPAGIINGVNTLLLSASSTPVPDVIALAATPTNDGIIKFPSPTGSAAFSVATVNVGSAGTITVSADTGSAALPVSITVCQTDPVSGGCVNPPAPAGTATMTIGAGETSTFALFLTASGNLPFNPAANRARVPFLNGGGIVRGSTSVALKTGSLSLPDIRGTYTGQGSTTTTNCLDPEDNTTLAFNGTLSISDQSGQTFAGIGVMLTNMPGFAIRDEHILSGTFDVQGAVNGTASGTVYVNDLPDSTYEGTFTGSVTGNTISLQFNSRDTSGDTCVSTGSYTVTR